MKVLLIFPPSWHPSQPYLSVPSLTAFLRQNGVADVAQRDLNIELLDVLLTKKTCGEFYQKIVEKLRQIDFAGEPPRRDVYGDGHDRRQALIEAAETIPSMLDRVETAKNTLRSDGFYDLDRYMESVHVVNEALGMMSALYYPSIVSAVNNGMRYSVYTSQDVFKALGDEEENIFLHLYKDHVLSSILATPPDVLGISITNTSQIIPGLTLAKLVKDRNKEIHVTVGGEHLYQAHRKYQRR